MRLYQIVGVVLILAGIFVLWQRPTYTRREDVVEIGEFKATVNQKESFPPWVGAAGIGAGAVLLFLAGRRRG
ncbi:MAG TPA: hypothetical protein VLT84_14145 [Acidobacteriota bacterium]|nr:hypothetical protein [Acidobacteriota bacterium]